MKPIYTPSNKIIRQYTYGQEYINSETKAEYKGPYHIYPTGQVYTGASPSKQSILLEKYTNVYNDPNSSMYARITGKQFNNHTAPKYFYPRPTQKDYASGFIERYIVQKKNELHLIYEISESDFRNINGRNTIGINAELYNAVRFRWMITGPREEVRATNKRILSFNERQIPGLSKYLSNLSEFSK
jgi:hypothetical protein